ncbi:MAG: 3-hydroxyacyl-ACP dehydratase FabZ [Limnochordia bacterium]|nr:3-hydroxyacyl-ACP dehydratase FabZ [Limnochordia bacterium]MDD4517467.1 3-hydroxyacyl-ACP dehydratase FabZ [Limnochordia bacterium]
MLDIRQIMDKIPHRYPFLLVDRIVELEPGRRAKALKNVTMNEAHFQGHYPGNPIMPGVLILEAMAQAAGVVVLPEDANVVPLFAGVDKAKFRRVVGPGDQLILEVEVLQARRKVAKIQGKAYVDGDLAAEAELLFMMASEE